MIKPIFYFYTNLLAPYMFHRWRLISNFFPGSLVIVTRRPDPGRPWKYSAEDMDFPCIAIPETITITNHLSWSRGLITKIRETKKNSNVIHLLEDISGLNTLALINSFPKDNFVIVNDGGFPETTKRLSQSMRWRLVGEKCKGVMSPGNFGKTYMKAWGFPEDKIFNSFLSSDVGFFSAYRDSELAKSDRNYIREGLDVKETDILILCNSRLLDWKRIEDLYESLGFLSQRAKDNISLLLIGDGPNKEPLNRLKENEKVRFNWIPAISYENVMKYYAASDMFVLPSEGDIWGLVINEALSMGKPVICTNRIGASELVTSGWNGFTIDTRDPKALANSIEKLVLNEDLRTQMSINAKNIENTWHSGLFLNELRKIVQVIYE
jgi:glycosyltransferase involved in cell wall biosynthesis